MLIRAFLIRLTPTHPMFGIGPKHQSGAVVRLLSFVQKSIFYTFPFQNLSEAIRYPISTRYLILIHYCLLVVAISNLLPIASSCDCNHLPPRYSIIGLVLNVDARHLRWSLLCLLKFLGLTFLYTMIARRNINIQKGLQFLYIFISQMTNIRVYQQLTCSLGSLVSTAFFLKYYMKNQRLHIAIPIIDLSVAQFRYFIENSLKVKRA